MLDTERYWQEEWAARVLRWARGKTRTAQEAEDLAQSVLMEWLRAVQAQEERGACVAEPEHLLWRIARFVWCKSLRPGTYYRCEPLSEKLSAGETPEESAERQDEQRRQTAFVRRQIMRLSRIQRETLVWYYLENRTTADIARRLRVSENTVRWHLSDSRKKIREADGKMTSTEFVYCPKKLHVAINGEAYDDRLTREVLDNLLHQNILLRCYAQGQTAQELCDELGVARPYIEDAVNVLLRDELLTADGGRVRTNFIITSGAQEEARLAVYDAHKDELSREIVRQLMAHEQEIRAIGFIGCDVPMPRLLWWLIYRCTAALPNPAEMPPRPYHTDGGAYHLMGFAREPENRHYLAWDYNGPMYNDGFRWFGLQHFGNSPVQDLFELNQPHMGKLCALLIRLIQADFDPSCVTADEQELLAELLARGFLRKADGSIKPNFCVLTREQVQRLRQEVFLPIVEAVQPAWTRVCNELRTLCKASVPKHLQALADLPLHMAALAAGYMTEQIAYAYGALEKPETPEDAAMWTLVYEPEIKVTPHK
ncbi:rNA polymerase sigma-24 subunit ECF subfamily [Faecalibacterium sp. CAG:74]|nr:rNA polymerase sigma-24 subunit ECF subfamily [Faecalibacterium sp. CAG:74]